MGRFLAFTRAQEPAPDQAGAKYLSAAGISGKGLLRVLQEAPEPGISARDLRRTATRGPTRFRRTHPGARARCSRRTPPGIAGPTPAQGALPAGQGQAGRLRRSKAGGDQISGERHRACPAHYARAYAYHLGGYPDKALAEADACSRRIRTTPISSSSRGRSCSKAASPPSHRAPEGGGEGSSDQPLIASMLGHALVSTEDPKNFAEAKPGAQSRGQPRQ